MSRLTQAFGIGIIELKSDPYQSKILFSAKHRDLDFETIDKLCGVNPGFEQFIEQVEKQITASDRYVSSVEKELVEFCDHFFESEEEILDYCNEHNIPLEQPGFEIKNF